MMTSLKNSPASRQARSSRVTVIRPLHADSGYWTSLQNQTVGQNTQPGLGQNLRSCCQYLKGRC